MTYMTSSAAVGSASVTIYFRQGINADMAAVNVQNRVSRATGQLPSEVTQIGVTTMKRQTSMIKIFSLYSPDDTYDETFLSNYLKINIEPRILRIAGVGEAFTLGADYSMRIWLKPDVMAQYKLVPSDVTAALAEQNIESATGTLGENSDNAFQYTMKYRGRYQTPEEFGEIVLLAKPDGTLLRLKDVADIELGSESYAYKGYTNGHPGVSAMVYQTAGSNATQVVNNINALLDEVEAELPKGVAIAHLHSVNDFLYASINEVIKTLIEAILLVILVVYVFLQDIRPGKVRGDDLEPFQFTAKGPAEHPLATGKHDSRAGHGPLLSHKGATPGAVFPETHPLPVLVRAVRPSHRPVHGKIGIIPAYAAFVFGMVVVGAFVMEVRHIAQHGKAVGQPRSDPELVLVGRGKYRTVPLAECGRAGADVHGHIKDLAQRDHDQLALRMLFLEVQPAQAAPA